LLPHTWDAFVKPYVGGQKGLDDNDPKKQITPQQFIGILKEEYKRCCACTKGEVNQASQVSGSSLAKHIGSSSTSKSPATGNAPGDGQGMFCCNCKQQNHNMANCHYIGVDKCQNCNKFGHTSKNCWNKKRKKNQNGANKKKAKKQKKNKTSNAPEETHTMIVDYKVVMDICKTDVGIKQVKQSLTALNTLNGFERSNFKFLS
jgi:hypothetical protein